MARSSRNFSNKYLTQRDELKKCTLCPRRGNCYKRYKSNQSNQFQKLVKT